ncbi:MAG: hypothetical protein K2N66_09630, partial [Paramuribaculum sp.]|nr:hypothetical protein [Paramuribaculum sp.]
MHSFIRLLTVTLLAASALMCPLQAGAQEQFKRGLERITFIPKGQWITGVNVNYSATDMNNYQFLVVENLSGDNYSFKVSPMLMYAFRDNLAAGARFSFERSMTTLNSGDVVIDSETDYN